MSMNKRGNALMETAVISVVGLDCPGVVYTVAETLAQAHVNIEAMTQTILQGQFASIFVAALPRGTEQARIKERIEAGIARRKMHLTVHIYPFEQNAAEKKPEESEPFVITVTGRDRPNVIASISKILFDHAVNIESLKAMLPAEGEDACLLVFEIALPVSVDRNAFRLTLLGKGEELGLRVSIQHRDIFEALHRISTI